MHHHHPIRTTIAGAIVVALVAQANAQNPVYTQLQIKKEALSADLAQAKLAGASLNPVLNPGNHPELYLLHLASALPMTRAEARDLTKVVEATRVDKQLGAGSSASGTTTVVDKGSVPQVLALAVENGALTRTQSGTTITFRGNPAGIINALSAGSTPVSGPLTRLAFGVTFDANRGAATGESPRFTGDEQQLSGFSAKYELINNRDPTSEAYQQRIGALYTTSQATSANQRLLAIVEDVVASLQRNGAHAMAFATWRAESVVAFEAARIGPELVNALDERLVALSTALALTAEERNRLAQYWTAYSELLSNRDDLLALAGQGTVMSVEYLNTRPLHEPTQSSIGFIYETSTKAGQIDLTFNAVVSFFNTTAGLPSELNRLRDWSVAAQMDAPLGSIIDGRSFVLTFAGKIQNMLMTPTMAMAELGAPSTASNKNTMLSMFASETDTIRLGQIKLTIPIKDGGVKIPISVTWASRTDLVDEAVVRGSIGFTLSLDSLL